MKNPPRRKTKNEKEIREHLANSVTELCQYVNLSIKSLRQGQEEAGEDEAVENLNHLEQSLYLHLGDIANALELMLNILGKDGYGYLEQSGEELKPIPNPHDIFPDAIKSDNTKLLVH